jgi:hypothetical protein
MSLEEEAFASLLAELCQEVGVVHIAELLPRIRQLCSAALMYPALDAFAEAVCDRLSEHTRLMVGMPAHASPELTLSEGYDTLLSVLQELRLGLLMRNTPAKRAR